MVMVMVMVMMMMMMIMIMIMIMMMMMIIMTIVSVKQRPGWGEHVKIQMLPGLVLDQTSYNSCINAAGAEALPAAWCYAAVQLSSMASMACERDQISALEALEALASFS